MGDSRVCRREYYSHPSPRGYPYSSHQTYRNNNYNNHRHQHQSHSQVEYLALSTNGEIHKTEPPFQHSSTRQQAPYLPYHRPQYQRHSPYPGQSSQRYSEPDNRPHTNHHYHHSHPNAFKRTHSNPSSSWNKDSEVNHHKKYRRSNSFETRQDTVNYRHNNRSFRSEERQFFRAEPIVKPRGRSHFNSTLKIDDNSDTDGEHPERPRNWRIHRVFSGKITTDSELGSYRPQARGQFPMMGIRKSNFNKWNNPVVESGRRKKRKPSCRVTLSDSSSSASSSQSEEDKYEDWVVNLQDSKENIETIEDEEFIDDILLLDEAGDETNSECLEVTSSSICVVYEQSDNTPSDSAKKLKYKSFGL